MKTLISDTFILPAFLVPSMYYCVCFLIEGEKKQLKNILEYSYLLSINRCCVFSWQSAKLALDCVFIFCFFCSSICLIVVFCGKICFCWKYRYREMILYIVIYKCVQRRKYINGFSQRGSMHELFLKMTRGKGHCICQCTFPKSNQIISVHSGYFVLSRRTRTSQKILLETQPEGHRHTSRKMLNNCEHTSFSSTEHHVIQRFFSNQLIQWAHHPTVAPLSSHLYGDDAFF